MCLQPLWRGDRTRQTKGDAHHILAKETPFTATYDAANRLTNITLNGEAFTLTYDTNGNLVSKSATVSGTTTYTWNARNQLIQIANPSMTASFKYDALGRRIAKTVNNQTVGFVYDGAQAIAEITGSAISVTYLTGLQIDEVLARYAGTGNKTLLTDALGSVIAQTNDQQGIQNFYAYTPYGEVQPLGPDDNNPIQYTGRENDHTGLYFYRARYYDPILKRFVSEDPIGMTAGPNFYAYLANGPTNAVDPLGLEKQFTIGVGGSVGGGLFPPGGVGPFLGAGANVGFTTCGSLIFQLQGSFSLGVGLFIGGGIQGGISTSPTPTPAGLSTQTYGQADINVGVGRSIGVSGQYGGSGTGGAQFPVPGTGRFGVGFGLQVSSGIGGQITLATPPLFCGCPNK